MNMIQADDNEPAEVDCQVEPCACCGGTVGVLGVLGNREYTLCRDCGAESSTLIEG
jgi:hypothetical protein